MARHLTSGMWSKIGVFSTTVALLAVLWPAPSVLSVEDADEPIIRVEEDWQLVLNEPDDAMSLPEPASRILVLYSC